MFESYGRKFKGIGGAEYDDLVQEAAIAGWLAMEAGYKPHETALKWACINWIRHVSHRGFVSERREEYRENSAPFSGTQKVSFWDDDTMQFVVYRRPIIHLDFL